MCVCERDTQIEENREKDNEREKVRDEKEEGREK